MDLVKSTVRLEFSEATHPWLEMREILRVAGENPTAELQANPMVLDQPEKRQRVVLAVRTLMVEQELPASADQSLAHAVDMITRLNDASQLPALKEIRYDSIFIEPYSLPFHELVVFLKQRFLRSSAVVDSATDIALVFDQHEGEIVRHMQIGPMDAEQLRQEFLRWPDENIPDTFLFLGLGYWCSKEAPFEAESLREFLNDAVAWQVNEAETLVNSLASEGR